MIIIESFLLLVIPTVLLTNHTAQIGRIFPAPFGRFGETGDKVHTLVAVMAKARVFKQNIVSRDTEKPFLSIETT